MADPAIAELIAEGLHSGLTHPGDPDKDVPPTPVRLAAFKAPPGAPAEMSDLINGTTKLVAEAIVHLIETKGGSQIVPAGELATLRLTAGESDGPLLMEISCRRCGQRTGRSLVVLSAGGDPSRIATDGPTLIRVLSAKSSRCPHDEEPDPAADALRAAIVDVVESMTGRQLPRKAREALLAALNPGVSP